MRRRAGSQSIWLTCFFSIGVLFLPQHGMGEEKCTEVELQQAVASLCQWRRELETIQLHFSWQLPETRFPLQSPQHLHTSGGHWHGRWVWADRWSGPLGAVLHMEARRHIEGPEQRFLFSRRNGYQFEWLWNLAEQAQPSFRMRRVRPCGTDFPYCPPLYHLYSPAAGWILENLTVKTHGRFGGREIDGHHCLGVQLHTASSLVYWLDPAKDGLPRLVEDIAAQEGWSWKCEEFRQLETGHWFPWRGHFGNAGVTAGWFEMQTVILNEPISRDSLALPALASISADVSFKEKTLPSTSSEPTWSSLLGAPWLLSIMVPLSGLLCFWRNLVPRAIISMAHSLREFVRSFFRKKEVEGLAR